MLMSHASITVQLSFCDVAPVCESNEILMKEPKITPKPSPAPRTPAKAMPTAVATVTSEKVVKEEKIEEEEKTEATEASEPILLTPVHPDGKVDPSRTRWGF